MLRIVGVQHHHLFMSAVLSLLAITPATAATSQRAAPIEFTLSDQDGQTRVVDYPREKVTVFVVADHKGSGEIAGWIAPLYQRYETGVEISGIAALPGIPPMFHGLFRREFKKRLTYPVMLDWSGDVARRFGYEKERAQLLVIGKDGRVALRQTGAANDRGLAEVFREIDRLRSAR
jgi:hypothetical protein